MISEACIALILAAGPLGVALGVLWQERKIRALRNRYAAEEAQRVADAYQRGVAAGKDRRAL